ncbi:MAG: UDP-N-acetylglucosamine 2-epimerase (non-hydrolyzing) [Candidatus Thiodiazotropha sp.]
MSKLIHLIAAARPNFMKIAPLYHELCKESWAEPVIVHTGQHYDLNMSDVFFHDLRLPEPHIHLGVGSGSHSQQTGKVGDVNSTIACTLAATKVNYNNFDADGKTCNRPIIAHLEAGLRSYDRSMPEEINRIATDLLADILWTPSIDGNENLINESRDPECITFVGNIMIDSLEMMRENIEAESVTSEHNLSSREYIVLTLHRPANVDNPKSLSNCCRMINRISEKLPVIFPVHPRTHKNLEEFGLLTDLVKKPGITLLEPLNYIRFMNLVVNCKAVITDSGGIQEETTYLGIPCLTLRQNTERPITILNGTNQLCTLDNIEQKLDALLAGESLNSSQIPEYWDGKTASRIVKSISSALRI